MGTSRTYEAIVLKTYDIGEADRFCILLTKERGKIAARAKGVRKLTSRMGGSLLPLQHIFINVHEGKSGFLITAIELQSQTPDKHSTDSENQLRNPSPERSEWCGVERNAQKQTKKNMSGFLSAQQGTELILKMIEDEHPVPKIFDLVSEFFKNCKPSALLPFTIRLLSIMGVLPSPTEGKLASYIQEDERNYLKKCSGDGWKNPPEISNMGSKRLNDLCNRIIDQQTSSVLKAGPIAAELAA